MNKIAKIAMVAAIGSSAFLSCTASADWVLNKELYGWSRGVGWSTISMQKVYYVGKHNDAVNVQLNGFRLSYVDKKYIGNRFPREYDDQHIRTASVKINNVNYNPETGLVRFGIYAQLDDATANPFWDDPIPYFDANISILILE